MSSCLRFSDGVVCVFSSEMVAIFCQAKVNSRQAAGHTGIGQKDAGRQDQKTKPARGGRKFTLALQSMQRIFLHPFCLPFSQSSFLSQLERKEKYARGVKGFIQLNVFIFPGAKGRATATGLGMNMPARCRPRMCRRTFGSMVGLGLKLLYWTCKEGMG